MSANRRDPAITTGAGLRDVQDYAHTGTTRRYDHSRHPRPQPRPRSCRIGPKAMYVRLVPAMDNSTNPTHRTSGRAHLWP